MQRIQTMTTIETIISAGVSAVAAWLIASVTKVSKRDFEKVVARIDLLEKDMSGRMTRAEFDNAFNKVEGLVKEFRLEARAEFKELKRELQTKT